VGVKNSMLNFGFGLLKWFALIVIVIVISHAIFLWTSCIDEKIIKGEGYGFTIGNSIDETYTDISKLSLLNSSEKVPSLTFDVDLYEENKTIPISVKSEFIVDQFDLFKDKNQWILYYLDTPYYFDSLALTFCGEELCEIRRYRFYWELP
jgi:hypothetical protein